MSARLDPMAHLVGERIAEVIRRHALDHPEQWAVTPATVIVNLTAAIDAAATPAVTVNPTGWIKGDEGNISDGAGTTNLFRDRLELTLIYKTADAERSLGAIEDLDADLFRCLAQNRQLALDPDVPLLPSGQLFFAGSEWGTDFSDSAGVAWGVMKIQVECMRTAITA